MKKIMSIRASTLAVAIAGATAALPCRTAEAAGFIDLNFENIPTVVGLGIGILPD